MPRLALLIALAASSALADDSPDPRLKGYRVAPGFKLAIAAEEPMVVNPVTMTWAPDGRLFVIEWKEGRQPNDHIKALSDTDGDGTFDKVEMYLDKLDLPAGIAFWDGWTYATLDHDVVRFHDPDLDGKYDRKEVIATGFGNDNSHHRVSGLTIGPDGWLYMTTGDSDCRAVGSDGSKATILRSGGVLRCKPDGSNLEVVAFGLRNPWGNVAFDDEFRIFHTDNDNEGAPGFTGCRLLHIVEGGDYGWRLREGARCCQPDYERATWNGGRPGRLGWIAETGRGAPAGLCILNSAAFPPSTRNMLIYPDVFRKLVRAYKLKPKGATFEVDKEFELIASDEGLFRPTDAEIGPDGALYILDWRTDSGGAGMLSGNGKTGRIYRLTWSGTAEEPARATLDRERIVSLPKKTDEEVFLSARAADFGLRWAALHELQRMQVYQKVKTEVELNQFRSQLLKDEKGNRDPLISISDLALVLTNPKAKRTVLGLAPVEGATPWDYFESYLYYAARRLQGGGAPSKTAIGRCSMELAGRFGRKDDGLLAYFASIEARPDRSASTPPPSEGNQAAPGVATPKPGVGPIEAAPKGNADGPPNRQALMRDPELVRAACMALGRFSGLPHVKPDLDPSYAGLLKRVAEKHRVGGATPRPEVYLQTFDSMETIAEWMTIEAVADRLMTLAVMLKDADPVTRDGITRSLDRLGHVGIKTLVSGIASSDQNRRQVAVFALQGCRSDEAKTAILTLIEKNGLPEGGYTESFRTLREFGPAVPPQPIAAYLKANAEADPQAAVEAIRVLAAMQGRAASAVGPILVDLLRSSNGEVRKAALNLATNVQSDEAKAVLLETVKDAGRSTDERRLALTAIRAYEDKSLAPTLATLYGTARDAGFLSELLKVLGSMDFDSAAKFSEEALKSKDSILRGEAIGVLGQRPETALKVANLYNEGKLPPEDLSRVLEAVRNHSSPELLAASQTLLKNKLLAAPTGDEARRLREFVAKNGNSARGKTIFYDAKKGNCATCHRIEGQGGAVGPDLTRVYETLSFDKRVESILEPSKEIKEGFGSFKVATKDGRVTTGLLVSKTDQAIVLKDAEGREVRIPAAEVEMSANEPTSLMPAGVVGHLSFAELADLLAFLGDKAAQDGLKIKSSK